MSAIHPDQARFAELMAACVAEPTAVDRRLVLADWLQERGDPLGEFIQLQCRLEELRPDEAGAARIATRATQIRRHNQRVWFGELLAPPIFEPNPRAWPTGWDKPAVTFRRGLVEHLSCTIGQLRAADVELSRRLPLRGLTLRSYRSDDDPSSVAGCSVLARVRSLSLELDRDDLPLETLRALLDGPSLRRGNLRELRLKLRCPADAALELVGELAHLRGLERLDSHFLLQDAVGQAGGAALSGLGALGELTLSTVDSAGVVALSQALRGPLRRLTLNGAIGATGARALSACAALGGLQSLTLLRSEIGPGGARALATAAAERMPRLTRLVLDGGAIQAKGGTALVEAERLLSRLEQLDLSSCRLPAAVAAALAGSPALARLRELSLADNNLSKGGLVAVLDGLRLPALRQLQLGGCRAGVEGAAAIASSGGLRGLRALGLSGNSLKDAGAAALSAADCLDGLKALNLSYNAIGAEGMAALAAGPLLAGVQELDLDHNKCQTRGGEALAACPHLSSLRKLVLNYNWMGKRGIRAILGNGRMGELRDLDLGENNYEEAGMAAVAQAAQIDKLERLTTREVTDAAVAALARSAAAESLVQLRVTAGVHDEGARALIDSPALGNLEELTLSFCRLSLDVQRALRERFGPLVYWGEPD